ncbi:MAG: hypothetical protein MUE78_11320 [Ilumatobacteraceae bacterium]|nr:hypothetical protein [Ilumatobacteraceae bacterium]
MSTIAIAAERRYDLRLVAVIAAVLAVVAVATALTFDSGSSPAPAATVALGPLVATWPERFELTGTKGVETWVEHVHVVRDGDRFVLTGGAPRGEVQQVRTVEVVGGELVETPCPDGGASGSSCVIEPAVGFLSTAALVAAAQRAELPVELPVLEYAGRSVVCPSARLLGIERSALDPCFDLATGAVLAQRDPDTGEFDGPSLDPWSVVVSIPPA